MKKKLFFPLAKCLYMYIHNVINDPRCGEAIGQNDLRKATQIIVELRELSSPNGSGVQRMAHYVTDALVIFL
jgi:hypothetical protein